MPFDSFGSTFDSEIADLERYIKWVVGILNNQEISEAQANSDFTRIGQSLLREIQRQKSEKEWLRNVHRERNRQSGIKY